MEILEGLNIGQSLIIVFLCVGFCIVGVFALIVIQIITGTLGFLLTIIELPLQLLTGEPLTGCGCILSLFACGICGVFTITVLSVIPQCSTPQAVNLCRLLGY